MRVLTIGYGRNLWQKNADRTRMIACAEAVDELHVVSFTKRKDDLQTVSVTDSLHLYSTSSASKWNIVFDAYRIGSDLIKTKQIDVISTQDVFETGLVGVLLKLKYPSVVLQVQEHGDVLSSLYWKREKFGNRIRLLLAEVVVRKADVVRVVSERTRQYIQTVFGREKKIVKLPVAIDTDSFAQASVSLEKTVKNTFTFLTAARFVSQKNFPLMLKAFAAAQKHCSHIRLRIFGTGEEEEEMLSLIQKLGIADVVVMTGWTDNLAKEMQQADAYLLTSNYEGWARVLIEAMVQKLPIVTTDVGCANEVVKNGVHGIVVPVGSLPDLVAAIKKIATDTQAYNTFKNNLNDVRVDDLPGANIDTYAAAWVETLR